MVDPSEFLERNNIRQVRVQAVNLDGAIKGKYLTTSAFVESLPGGPNLPDSVFMNSTDGTPSFGWQLAGWHGDIADLQLSPDLETLVIDPRTTGLSSVLCDFTDSAGNSIEACPRGTVRRLMDRLAQHGYQASIALEVEATLFEESPAEARSKGFRELAPMGGPQSVEYLVHQPTAVMAFVEAWTRRLEGLGIPWETWIGEWGPGQIEVTMPPSDPLTAADRTIRAKLAAGEIADEVDHAVTFLPVWSEHGGVTGFHVNISLWRDGSNAFFDPSVVGNRSRVLDSVVAGLIETMPAATSFMYPTVNAFRRMAELSSSPTRPLWAEDNKTVAVRTVARGPETARVEYRLPASDANAYLAVAAVLAGTLIGLEDDPELPPEFKGMGWSLPSIYPTLPHSMPEALKALAENERFATTIGGELVEYWTGTRRWDWWQFCEAGLDTSGDVTDWELQRGF